MTTDWDGEGTPQAPGPVHRLDTNATGWPTRAAGYAKLLWTAATTLGTSGIIAWLQAAGATHLPPWVSAGITAVIGIGTVLLSPKNKA